jgi:hypothetical protein
MGVVQYLRAPAGTVRTHTATAEGGSQQLWFSDAIGSCGRSLGAGRPQSPVLNPIEEIKRRLILSMRCWPGTQGC